MAGMNGREEISFEIKEYIGVIDVYANGWQKEINSVSWNGGPAKIDIRDWDPGHTRMSRGITLTEKQAEKLAAHLSNRYRAREEHAAVTPTRVDLSR